MKKKYVSPILKILNNRSEVISYFGYKKGLDILLALNW